MRSLISREHQEKLAFVLERVSSEIDVNGVEIEEEMLMFWSVILQNIEFIKEAAFSSLLKLYDDRFDIDVTPLGSDPVLTLSVDQPFSEWSQEMLEVDARCLVPICVSDGSTQFHIQLANTLNEDFPEIQKKDFKDSDSH